ncbi:response regulator transcription factor [Pedobacter glucosidilyticus]|uniref:response regulator transcription factor n=1 Tax=Pedobacter glucosidilyticus TaxID=1122941 RepID=UPI0026ECC6C4|nr:response regulator transcription factor [Pedobacter glucosidilyticus]
MKKIPIAIVDDKRLLRNALKDQINFSNAIEVLFIAEDGVDFLKQMEERAPSERPLVVMMDIEMPRMDGLETVLIAKQIYPDVQFIMLTVFDDENKIFEAIKAGACGYLLKDEKIPVIIKSIKDVIEDGAVPMSATVARKTLLMIKQVPEKETTQTQNSEYQLSTREMSILELIVDGLNYQEIAEKLFISPHTVRKHIANIYEKLHVSNKTAAIKIALKKKWF